MSTTLATILDSLADHAKFSAAGAASRSLALHVVEATSRDGVHVVWSLDGRRVSRVSLVAKLLPERPVFAYADECPEGAAAKAGERELGGDWSGAARWWEIARAVSVGHNRRDRYDAAAERCWARYFAS